MLCSDLVWGGREERGRKIKLLWLTQKSSLLKVIRTKCRQISPPTKQQQNQQFQWWTIKNIKQKSGMQIDPHTPATFQILSQFLFYSLWLNAIEIELITLLLPLSGGGEKYSLCLIYLSRELTTTTAQTCLGSCWLAAWLGPPCCYFPRQKQFGQVFQHT